MSHRSRRSSDRDRSHSSSYSSHRHDKYEYRPRRDDSRHQRDDSRHRKDDSKHRRDDSRDRSERYYSRKKSKRDHSRSRYRSRSYSRHRDEHYNRSSYKTKEYKELPESTNERRHETIEEKIYTQPTVPAPDFSLNAMNRNEDVGHFYENHSESDPSAVFDLNNDDDDSVPLPASSTSIPGDPFDEEDEALREERERVQRETMKRLQKHLQNEGKLYPPKPKPQAVHPIFANDGSFLEMFKSMQGNLKHHQPHYQTAELAQPIAMPSAYAAATTSTSNTIPRAAVPTIKRRGGKILKTGIVQKQRTTDDGEDAQPTDSWNAYLKEVKRYKNVTCSDDNITRSLVK